MKKIHNLLANTIFTILLTCVAFLQVRGYPVQSMGIVHSKFEGRLTNSNGHHTQSTKNISDCKTVEYELNDVTFLKNNNIFLKEKNITVHPKNYQTKDEKIFICLPTVDESNLNCTDKFEYESYEYEILSNKSAIVGDELVPEKEYELRGDILLICAPDYDAVVRGGLSLPEISIYVGKIGSGISIIALIIHLMAFIYLPSMRNLHGCNLASLSVAFLLAYAFVLIGQIPQVLGTFCVISGILQQNFFLVAFFCMNVLAFDIWRTLKQATEKLVFKPQNARNKQFLWYSLYAWGVPMAITSISVIVNNIEGIPDIIKPDYGKNNICWMGNKISKAIFFAVPAFTLFIINGIFFVITAWILLSNKMKCSKEQKNHAAKNNFFLYVKLALMMGLTWLVGIIALISQVEELWFIFDLLNSLQGLFLLLLFTCTSKVLKKIVEKTSMMKVSFAKQTVDPRNSASISAKTETRASRFITF